MSSRIAKGYTRQDMAAKLGVSYELIKRAEADAKARQPVLMAWALVVGVPAEYLLEPAGYTIGPARGEVA